MFDESISIRGFRFVHWFVKLLEKDLLPVCVGLHFRYVFSRNFETHHVLEELNIFVTLGSLLKLLQCDCLYCPSR